MNYLLIFLIVALTVSILINIYLRSELKDWKDKYWSENRLAFTTEEEAKQEEPENFVHKTNVKAATAETYAIVFDEDPNGQRVLEDLTRRFCKASYVRGGQDAERESCYRAGQNSIPQFIITQINRANNPETLEENTND